MEVPMSRLGQTSFEPLEPYDGKLSSTVLRGESPRKGADLLDNDASTYTALLLEQSGIFVPQYTNIHSFFIHINSNGWLSKEESLYL